MDGEEMGLVLRCPWRAVARRNVVVLSSVFSLTFVGNMKHENDKLLLVFLCLGRHGCMLVLYSTHHCLFLCDHHMRPCDRMFVCDEHT